MNQVQAFLYGRHAKRKIPSGQRDPGEYEGRHRDRYVVGEPPPLGQVRVFEADPSQPHRRCFIAVHTGRWRFRPLHSLT